MDSEHQQHLIEQLIPLLRERDFEMLFNQVTGQESRHSCFLIKMDLERKCMPCRRVIDMREVLTNECLMYEFDNIIHFMPAEAIDLFQSQCFLYRGAYTLGVYEAIERWQKKYLQGRAGGQLVTSGNPVRYHDVNTIDFANYYGRSEDRIHFSTPVLIGRPTGEWLLAKSSDLSLGGLRVAFTECPDYVSGEQVSVLFTGLGDKYPDPVLQQPVSYQILGEECRGEKYWLRLLRCGENAAFDVFLKGFIQTHKVRYRVSVDHLLSAATIKGYEQFYLSRMTGMPLFFSFGPTPALEVVLRTENNQHVLQYWRDEKNRDTLAGLFFAERMTRLCPAPGLTTDTLIYCFTHSVRSHLYFFSATMDELRQRGLTRLFFQVGARRSSWRVYKFSIEACEPSEAELGQQQGGCSEQHQDVLLRERLKQIGYAGWLQDITFESQRTEFADHDGLADDANPLRCFGHDLGGGVFGIETLYHVKLRKEQRYIHKTTVVIHHHGRSWVGWTRDISTQGLQIELEEPFTGEQGEVVTIALPRLQELSKKMDLQRLAYRLVSQNLAHTVLHLCIDGEADRHIGRQFFSLLIENNQSKLRATAEQRRYPGLAQALRNIHLHHLFNTPVYISKLQGVIKPVAIGQSLLPRGLSPLLLACAEQPEQGNLYPLFQGDLFKALVLDPLRAMVREDKPTECEVYIAVTGLGADQPQFNSCLGSSFASVRERRQFIERARQQGVFYSVLVGISRTGCPDTHFIANELDYIAKFAIHKAKQLEDTLWSVMGVGELTDTTQATLFRLGITAQ